MFCRAKEADAVSETSKWKSQRLAPYLCETMIASKQEKHDSPVGTITWVHLTADAFYLVNIGICRRSVLFVLPCPIIETHNLLLPKHYAHTHCRYRQSSGKCIIGLLDFMWIFSYRLTTWNTTRQFVWGVSFWT